MSPASFSVNLNVGHRVIRLSTIAYGWGHVSILHEKNEDARSRR